MYRDHFQDFREDQDAHLLIHQYEEMLREGNMAFFEKYEFTQLLNHYEKQQQTKEALQVIEHALAQHPYTAQFLIRKAHILMDESREPEAMALLDQAEIYDASEVDIYLIRAEILSSYERFDEAKATLDAARMRMSQSDLEDWHLAYASIYEDMEEYAEMFDALKSVLDINAENEDALERIWLSMELSGRYQEGVELFNQLIDKNAYNALSWYNLGNAHIGLKQYEKATEAFDYCLTIREDYGFAYAACAEAWLALNKHEKAIKVLKAALEVFPKHFDFCLQLATCYESVSNYRQARYYFQKCTKIDPKEAGVYYRIGECYAKEERWKEAHKSYQQAHRIEGNNASYVAAVAEANYQLDNNEDADALFQEAIALDPVSDEIWVQYISFLIAQENYGEALDALGVAEGFCYTLELRCCEVVARFYKGQIKEAILMLQRMVWSDEETAQVLLDLFPELQNEPMILHTLLRR